MLAPLLRFKLVPLISVDMLIQDWIHLSITVLTNVHPILINWHGSLNFSVLNITSVHSLYWIGVTIFFNLCPVVGIYLREVKGTRLVKFCFHFVNWYNIMVFLFCFLCGVFPLTTLDNDVAPRVLTLMFYMTTFLNMLIRKAVNFCTIPLCNRMQHNWGFQVNPQRTSCIFFQGCFLNDVKRDE